MIDATLRRLRSVQFEGKAALLCLPALALTMGYGLFTGDHVASSVAVGGALAVGFGSVHAFTRWRWATMVLAAAGMSISTFVGSIAGNDEIAFMAVAAAWAAACAIFASIEFGAWWIVLQWSVALFVAGYYPADLIGAGERAALVLAGGVLQIACVTIGWRLEGGAPPAAAHHSLRRVRKTLRLVRKGKLPTLRHAVRAGASVALASAIVHWLALPNGYWAPMTALLVLKPQLRATRTRGLERLVGTLAGAGVAGLISLAAPSGAALLVLTLAAAWFAYGLQRSDYVVFTVAITATIVFVLAVDHTSELLTAWHRLLATILGGVLALSVAHFTNSGWLRRTVFRSELHHR
jgi:hypothetical protein